MRLVSVRGSEDDLLAALMFEGSAASEDEIRTALRVLPPDERATLLSELVGDRRNRRYRPGRGYESVSYRFEIVSDYGAFRDLQRHRMLTVQWQPLTPSLGAGVPDELADAGVADAYRAGLDASATEYARLVDAGLTLPGLHQADPQRVALETYPGFSARKLVPGSYKNDAPAKQTPARRHRRTRLVRLLSAVGNPFGFVLSASAGLLSSLVSDASGDRLDAVLCAMQAAWAWDRRKQNYGLPADVDALEGWIAMVPRPSEH